MFKVRYHGKQDHYPEICKALYADRYDARSAIWSAVGNHGFYVDQLTRTEAWNESDAIGSGFYEIYKLAD